MSLKAYDGMMTRKSIKYIQDEIVKRMDRLKEASENKLAKSYAGIFIDYFDSNFSVVENIKYDTLNEEVALKNKIDEIKITDETTIWSYIYQASKILAEGRYINRFMVHLNISLEAVNNRKILVYPHIIVNEHKSILLEFLEDWYCQNQCDPDERVNSRVWKQREKDWYNFNEITGFNMKIQLFEPSNLLDSIVRNFRGEEAIEKILKFIPSDEERLNKIVKQIIIKREKENCKQKNIYFDPSELLKNINSEIEDYIKTHNIILTKIDNDCIKNAKLNYNPISEIRKEKLQEIKKNLDK